jgi:uncharacterized phage-associated protein
MAHDVRDIANLIIDESRNKGVQITNLSLNKIIYFLHASYLFEFNEPLVSAKIEAWDHGPVFREIYHQFKSFGRSTITGRARRLDVATGKFFEAEPSLSPDEDVFLRSLCSELLKIPAGKLVDMSHVEDGPWYQARYGGGRVNPGVEITDALILEAQEQLSRH